MSSPASSPLALHGGQPVRDTALRPWSSWPIHGQEERQGLLEVLESGQWWYGERVARFEREYAAFQGAEHAISCSSGTTALELMLEARGLRPGDEVIVPPYTFIATATAVMRFGGIPVFADIDESWCIDPGQVEAVITPRTRFIMPVHFAGRVCDMDRINDIAARHGITVIEDACHSWGSRWKGQGTGTLSLGGAFSFQHSKNITAAEGGAIVTDDAEFADKCRSLSNCGRDPKQGGYRHINRGTNARISEFAAAILLAQLARLEEQTARREANGSYLSTRLSQIEGITPQPGDARITRRAYHLYCLRIDPEAFGCSRARFLEAARAEGLDIVPGYPMPIYRQPVFARQERYADLALPMVEDFGDRSALWFRHALLLGNTSDMDDIAAIVQKVKDHAHSLVD